MPFTPYHFDGGRNLVVFGGELSDDQAFVGQRLKPCVDRVDQAAFFSEFDEQPRRECPTAHD